MNYGAWLFLGVLLTFASSWVGLVLAPQRQLGGLQPSAPPAAPGPVTAESAAAASIKYPLPYVATPAGDQAAGRRVYIRDGCVYCHTQQVRSGKWQADIERGWGTRRTTPQDYLNDDPILLGTMRTGPDLTNIGVRQSSAEWHLKHLWAPKSTSPGSIMPPFRHLFEVRAVVDGKRSPDALDLPPEFAPGAGLEVVPTADARDLTAYIKAMDHTWPADPRWDGGRIR